ncbi:MAG: hypothetical protein IJL97_02050, partial [Lachnospiraceae bacterium]|nr:hypothetical protein [Lachnospiraceae bacterium]
MHKFKIMLVLFALALLLSCTAGTVSAEPGPEDESAVTVLLSVKCGGSVVISDTDGTVIMTAEGSGTQTIAKDPEGGLISEAYTYTKEEYAQLGEFYAFDISGHKELKVEVYPDKGNINNNFYLFDADFAQDMSVELPEGICKTYISHTFDPGEKVFIYADYISEGAGDAFIKDNFSECLHVNTPYDQAAPDAAAASEKGTYTWENYIYYANTYTRDYKATFRGKTSTAWCGFASAYPPGGDARSYTGTVYILNRGHDSMFAGDLTDVLRYALLTNPCNGPVKDSCGLWSGSFMSAGDYAATHEMVSAIAMGNAIFASTSEALQNALPAINNWIKNNPRTLQRIEVYAICSNKPGYQPIIWYTYFEDNGRIELLKTDASTGDPLKGAVFDIYDSPELTDPVRASVTSGTDGIIRWEGLEVNKTYYVKESYSPVNYSGSDEVYTFVVTSEEPEPKAVTVPNNRITRTFNIILEKTDDAENRLSGAVFTLTKPNGKKVKAVTGTDGKAVFRNLDPGTYTIKETAAPDGYEKSTESISVELSKDIVKRAYRVLGRTDAQILRDQEGLAYWSERFDN